MATRVGLLDSDSDVSETEDELTPLGVANRSRKPPIDDDFMDEDAPGGFSESLGRGDAIDLTDAMRALREHEDAVRAIENDRYVDADVDAAATGAARAREDAETRDGDSNGRAAVSTARPRAPLAAKAVAVAVRALELKSCDVRTSAPTTFETTFGGVDAYGGRSGSRGAAHGPRGVVGAPAIESDAVVLKAVRTRATFESVEGALAVALDQAVRRADGGLRLACSREAREAAPYGVAAVCLRHLEAVVESLASSSGDLDDNRARARAEAEVSAWALTSELFAEDKFGAARGTAAEVHRRRAGVSTWLRDQVARTRPSEDELEGRRAMLTHAAGGRKVSAARAAAAHGDPRLATFLAQIGSSKNVAFYAKQQLTRWRVNSVGKYVDSESEQAFKLLAGEVERDADGMGWYQNLGLHLWLASGPTSPLREVVQKYLDAVATDRAANPVPPIAGYECLDANQAIHLRDVAFNILALAASTEDNGCSPTAAEVRVAFHPLTYSDDVLDSSLAWHLFGILDAIDVLAGEEMDALADEITVAFATQLLGMSANGHCEWAVFVAQHLRDPVRRVKTTSHILRERIEEWNGDDAKVTFMLEACSVAQNQLDEARALWATYTIPRP
ncbi:Nuclear protein 96 [Ostreococcus tauri]|uniref:Nuclear protein 96 n=1 Tax=Ostreococcus tauri TaxID=70448 RepID=A0A090MA06_OSTTA|nr:Nuclear protein 96 [Ostreococcus tauri]CEF99562.1 Nuclear protein 96 [Ostreococcus tauri]|eukprot:XP_003081890.2 Nuclear protein 96 [Ostreococcus tauri]